MTVVRLHHDSQAAAHRHKGQRQAGILDAPAYEDVMMECTRHISALNRRVRSHGTVPL